MQRKTIRSGRVAKFDAGLCLPPALARAFGLGAAVLALAGCAAIPEDEPDLDGHEPTGERDDEVGSGTVEDAMKAFCSTSSILPLSQQIIDEAQCIEPDAYVALPERPNLIVQANVFPYLETPARDALVKALDANPSKNLTVISMLRTVAQQYLLYRWYQFGKCGISLAAKPGNSKHETGLAIDLSPSASWRSALQSRGFKWIGSKDPNHYDYVGPGAISYKGLDVEAFQRLWNRNNPNDKIAEDGIWGPATEGRMKKSPAAGFAKGAICKEPASDPVDEGGATCADFPEGAYQCAPDGMGRGMCSGGAVDFESCANGCLKVTGQDDVCMGTTSTWSCNGTYGTQKMEDGNYYATSFGCWVDENGVAHTDPGDNCIPGCFNQIKQQGLCTSGMDGPMCERHINWFAADAGRFGCGAKLYVENPENGAAAVVAVIDYGPACWVEDKVDDGVLDLSYRVTEHLFGDQVGVTEKRGVHVIEVDPSTPIGPVD